MQLRRFQADSLEATYRVVDEGGGGPTLVCLGGLGGTHLVWSTFVRNLRSRYRIIILDYPGLAAGEALPEETKISVGMLVGLLRTVFDLEKIESACLIGWSMGVQIGFEFVRSHPRRVDAFVAACGLAGQPFVDEPKGEPLAAILGMGPSVSIAVDWLGDRLNRVERVRAMLRRIDHPTRWAKRIGLVDPLMDEIVFDAVIRDFLSLDVGTFNRYAKAVARHDASDVLSTITFPTLLLAGEKDRFTKPIRLKAMSAEIDTAEFMVIRGASHYLPLEYGTLFSLKTDDFITRYQLS